MRATRRAYAARSAGSPETSQAFVPPVTLYNSVNPSRSSTLAPIEER